ncbi:hypothetical protein DL96DRAFT_1013144 [Flagelloscypha sp. PMI_526]|nr:hypothetical protein DL96DRAFT_1013144 [Flagelloscypha sp. PMI_526]
MPPSGLQLSSLSIMPRSPLPLELWHDVFAILAYEAKSRSELLPYLSISRGAYLCVRALMYQTYTCMGFGPFQKKLFLALEAAPPEVADLVRRVYVSWDLIDAGSEEEKILIRILNMCSSGIQRLALWPTRAGMQVCPTLYSVVSNLGNLRMLETHASYFGLLVGRGALGKKGTVDREPPRPVWMNSLTRLSLVFWDLENMGERKVEVMAGINFAELPCLTHVALVLGDFRPIVEILLSKRSSIQMILVVSMYVSLEKPKEEWPAFIEDPRVVYYIASQPPTRRGVGQRPLGPLFVDDPLDDWGEIAVRGDPMVWAWAETAMSEGRRTFQRPSSS